MTLRVVSLVPSLTETLLSLGVAPVACTRFCEQPSIAHVGGTKNPDLDAIVALAPDVVLMDREENRRQDADALAARGVEVFATHVVSVGDVAATIGSLRVLLGLAGPSGQDLADLAAQPSPAAPGRPTFVAIWRRPWMTLSGRTYGSSLLNSIGVANVFADHPDTYPNVTLDEVAGRCPELVLLPSEPYPFKERHIAEVESALSARVVLIDGQDLFWWGARTSAAATRLAHALRIGSP